MHDFRPRGLGEIIDRAIAMYVRNFVFFALVTLIAAAIWLGFFAVRVSSVTLLSIMWHNHALDVLVQSVLALISAGLLTVFIAVYYFDVRTRAEGLDLQARLQSVRGVLGTS